LIPTKMSASSSDSSSNGSSSLARNEAVSAVLG
jgi:hypothetical protein